MYSVILQIDWERYFYTVVPEELHWYLDEDPIVNLNEVQYLKDVDALLKVFS